MLWRLYECLETLVKELGFVVESIKAVCPRCRQTTLPLYQVRNDALKDSKASKTCTRDDCQTNPLVALEADEEVAAVERALDLDADDDDDDSEGQDGNSSSSKTTFEVSGFALTLFGLLALRAPRKRATVVNAAFTRALEVSDPENAGLRLSMLDRAWSILQT